MTLLERLQAALGKEDSVKSPDAPVKVKFKKKFKRKKKDKDAEARKALQGPSSDKL